MRVNCSSLQKQQAEIYNTASISGIRRAVENKGAIALISGGLDSILAAKLVMEQGFDIIGLYCTSAFSKSYGNEGQTHAARVSKAVGIDLRVLDMGRDYIDLVRKPSHGYGKHVNPCIDCKIYMLKKAKNLMKELNASFVITGEVLGQRPMSQRRDALDVIERDADMRGMILRPLSASCCSPQKRSCKDWSSGISSWASAADRERSNSSSRNDSAFGDTPHRPAGASLQTRTCGKAARPVRG